MREGWGTVSRVRIRARGLAAVVALLAVLLLVAACAGPRPLQDRPELVPIRAPSQPPPPSGSFTVVASGDVLVHQPLTEQARADSAGAGLDFGPLLAGVAPVVSAADLALCHIEVPLAEPDGPFTGYPSFNAPPQIAAALAQTGYDSCSTASNHTLDQGADGVFRTLDALDAAGLAHTGSARSAREDDTPLIHDVGPARVAHLSYTYGYNGLELPDGSPWLADTLAAEAVLADAWQAEQAGADVVIASLHWGQEYRHEPTDEQLALAQRLLADPAIDLIVGHHAHVVQPFERIGGEWVAYGLGNHVARHDEPRGVSEEGAVARFTFGRDLAGRWRVQRAEYVPTLVELGPPIRLRDLTAVPPTARRNRALQRIDDVVTSRGATADGLTRPAR